MTDERYPTCTRRGCKNDAIYQGRVKSGDGVKEHKARCINHPPIKIDDLITTTGAELLWLSKELMEEEEEDRG